MIEALKDPETWLFALFAALNSVPNSLTNQLQIIVVSIGFTTLQTTLLGCVGGVIGIVAIYTGVNITSRIPDSIAWVGIAYFVPSLLGLFLVNLLPWHDKVGLLFSVWIQGAHDILLRGELIQTLVISYLGHWFCLSPGLGSTDDGWPYKENYNKRHHIDCVLHGQCCRAVHVAK